MRETAVEATEADGCPETKHDDGGRLSPGLRGTVTDPPWESWGPLKVKQGKFQDHEHEASSLHRLLCPQLGRLWALDQQTGQYAPSGDRRILVVGREEEGGLMATLALAMGR